MQLMSSVTQVRAHENIRLKVAQLILRLTKKITSRLKSIVSGLDVYRLEKLIEFIDNIEYWRIIIPQEIGVVGGYVDMDLFGRIIFEFKSKEAEFDDGYKKVIDKYLPFYPQAKYVVITNWDSWRIYKVKEINKLEIIYEGDRHNAIPILERIIEDILKLEGYKIPPHPDAIARVFKDLTQFEKPLLSVFRKISDDSRVRPLYEAFKTIVITLYSEADESFIEHLFIKHTILQMIVLASLSKVLEKTGDPIEMCRGSALDVEVALPYLNWWFIAYTKLSEQLSEDDINTIKELTTEIVTRINMIDWEVAYIEDVFREFYELLIDPETRRKIGEYYTPLWIVELILSYVRDIVGDLKGRIILDPFCGSGTFLVLSFHEKVRSGESPDEAIKEIIGFDINPLAVSIARAELILAYRKYVHGKQYIIPKPLIFHTDTLYAIYGSGILSFSKQVNPKKDILSYLEDKSEKLKEMDIIEREVLNLVIPYLTKELEKIKEKPRENLIDLLRIEEDLARILRTSLRYCEKVSDGTMKDCLLNTIKNKLLEAIKSGRLGKATIGKIFKELILNKIDEFCEALAELLEKYGNGVWSATIVSMLAPLVIKHIRVDIVITNPPWLQLTKFKASYAEKILSKASKLIYVTTRLPENVGSRVIMGSDLASMALYGALNIAERAVAYVMPREASFYAMSSQRSGILLTYAVLKKHETRIDRVEIIDLNFDAFQHGNYPALLIISMKES